MNDVRKMTEDEIDELRLKAFMTNLPEDREAYFLAASKWFQDRHYRAMARAPAPDAQCCMCGKRGMSTVEDGGPECQLTDGRWTCSRECYYRAVEPAPDARAADVAYLVETAQWARNRLEAIADAAWHGDGRDFKRALIGVFADFDAALAACGSVMPDEIRQGFAPVYAPDARAEGMREAAEIARNRWEEWEDDCGVICDVTACEDIADAILAAIPAPAQWTPPPEAERPEGFRCQAYTKEGWNYVKWRAWECGGGCWMPTYSSQDDGDYGVVWPAPTAFAPLPPAPAQGDAP